MIVEHHLYAYNITLIGRFIAYFIMMALYPNVSSLDYKYM